MCGGGGQVVRVLVLYPMIRVQIPLKMTFFIEILFEKNENKQKEAKKRQKEAGEGTF